PVRGRIAQHRLHVVPRLGERNGFHKLRRLLEIREFDPLEHVRLAGVVGSERLLPLPAPLIEQRPEVGGSQPQIHRRLKQHVRAELTDTGPPPTLSPPPCNTLRQSARSRPYTP